MSEQINVDQAFDPEARKAQADFDSYMDSRPYKDDNGRVHAADTGNFANLDETMESRRTDHYDESLLEGDYSGESLDQLAKRVADARADNDKTRVNDAEEAFFAKFNEYAEKYGWEDEKIDESATGQLAVDKNAKIGRDTVDARLERYGKIMYDEAMPEIPVAESTTSEEQPEPSASGTSEETEEATTPDAEDEADKPLSIDEQIEAAKAKLAADADARAEKVINDMNETDQAKADRELLHPISIEGLEPVGGSVAEADPLSLDGLEPVDGPNVEPAREGESLDEYEARMSEAQELDTVDTGGLESVDEDVDELTQARSRRERMRDLFTAAGFATEVARLSSAAKEKLGKHKKAKLALGILAVGGGLAAYYLMKDSGQAPSGGGSSSGSDAFKDLFDVNVPEQPSGSSGGGSEELLTNGAWNIPKGSGGEALMERLGADKTVWYEHQDEFLKQFPDQAYRMSDGNVGFDDPGRLSKGAIKYWSRFAK